MRPDDVTDRLDTLADVGDETTVLAVWAARVADAHGDTVEADRWALVAAESVGRLF